MPMSIVDRKVVALLVGGFTLVILLMLATGKRGLDALRELEQGSTGLLSEERASGKALSSAQELETEFDQIFYAIPGVGPSLTPDRLRPRLDALEAAVLRISREALNSAEQDDTAQWQEFRAAGLAFVGQMRATIDGPAGSTPLAAVSQSHERLLAAVHQLVIENDLRNEEILNQDREAFAQAVGASIRLLALTAGIAIVAAAATVFLVQRLLGRLAWQRAELARLSSDMLSTQEATLRQVSHDLHDQIGQTLTALEANLSALEGASRDWAIRGRVEDCIGLVQDLMSQARGMSHLLRPSILDDFGLSVALESLAESFTQRTGIVVAFRSTCGGRLPGDTETHLFRIAQEALTNVARHSGANRVELTLLERNGHVELTVEDNGRGLPKPAGVGRSFNSAQTPAAEPRGLGLRSMRARAQQIGGTIEMTNEAGRGLRIVVHAPSVEAARHESPHPVAAG
jgi:signal transduction histidine kinase